MCIRDRVYSLFPRLKERSWQAGGTLSGGEQQMLAVGRALMSRPKLLMMDEPSLGLAPLAVSYTHLDVYKRQVLLTAGNDDSVLQTRCTCLSVESRSWGREAHLRLVPTQCGLDSLSFRTGFVNGF